MMRAFLPSRILVLARRRLRRFRADEDGVVLIATTILAPLLLVMLAFAVEMGSAFSMRAEQQRAADIAAFSGARMSARGSAEAALQHAAAIAALNSPAASDRLVTSTTVDDQGAVLAMVERVYPLQIARLAGLGDSLTIRAEAIAASVSAGMSCIMALNPGGAGVMLTGGTSILANDCEVSSNHGVSVPCGTYIRADAVTYNGSEPVIGCGGITTPEGAVAPLRQMSLTDPLAEHEGIAGLESLRIAAAELAGPEAPSGADIQLNWNPASPPVLPAGCVANGFSGNKWTLTCAERAEPYEFGDLIVPGGMGLDFISGSPDNTYRFNKIDIRSSDAVTFGPGNYEISDSLKIQGDKPVRFGSGNFRLGSDPSRDFFDLGGGSKLYFGAAGTFEVVGNIHSKGGSCLYLPSASTHLVRGNLVSRGGVSLGSGLWVFDGVVDLGTEGGGEVNCEYGAISLHAVDTTIVLNGNNSGSSTCATLCLGAGYRNGRMTAPQSGPLAGIAVVGPTDHIAGPALITSGAANAVVEGVFYFPLHPIVMSGGASLTDGTRCMQLIGAEIQVLEGGMIRVSNCEEVVASNQRTRLLR